MNTILNLNSKLYIGQGRNRACYIHPDNENLCVKVLLDGINPRGAQNEVKYYKRLDKRNISWNMIAKYFGNVQTNMGDGETFELIRDYDGNISKSVEYYLKLNNNDMNKEIIKLLEDLRHFLINEQILFHEITLSNILLKKCNRTTSKLIIIDGIGTSNTLLKLIHIKTLIFGRAKKKWNKERLKWPKKFPCLKNNVKKYDS